MEQPNSTPYVPDSYLRTMDLPVSDLPFRSECSAPITPEAHQDSFDEGSYLNTMPREILSFPMSGVADGSLDPWLGDMPATASPDLTRISLSPHHGIATPPPDTFCLQPFPEHLPAPAYHLLQQPQPPRCYSTGHPDWATGGQDWGRNYPEMEIWNTQSFETQPWLSGSYDGINPPGTVSSQNNPSNSGMAPFREVAPGYSAVFEVIQPELTASHEARSLGEDGNEAEDDNDEDSSDEESDSEDEASDCSTAKASSPQARLRTRSPGPLIDRWAVTINTIRQLETRNFRCNAPECDASFVRPEHLRRHVRSKHTGKREHACEIMGCNTLFSRGDNLREHYWTHLDRGGRAGKNKKMPLAQLKIILGPKEKKLIRKLREKLRQYHERQRMKIQRVARPLYSVRSRL